MSNDRNLAGALLTTAKQAVVTERANHGDVASSFQAIADSWSTYINHVMAHRGTGVQLDARDVLHMMTDLKRYRSVFGDEANPDNYVDMAGYTALAGMVRLRDGTGLVVADEEKRS